MRERHWRPMAIPDEEEPEEVETDLLKLFVNFVSLMVLLAGLALILVVYYGY